MNTTYSLDIILVALEHLGIAPLGEVSSLICLALGLGSQLGLGSSLLLLELLQREGLGSLGLGRRGLDGSLSRGSLGGALSSSLNRCSLGSLNNENVKRECRLVIVMLNVMYLGGGLGDLRVGLSLQLVLGSAPVALAASAALDLGALSTAQVEWLDFKL